MAVVVATNIYLLALVLPMFLLFFKLRVILISTAREARRLESVARSPIFSLLSETLDGLVTIRSLGAEARFTRSFYDCLDGYSRPYFTFVGSGRYFGYRLVRHVLRGETPILTGKT